MREKRASGARRKRREAARSNAVAAPADPGEREAARFPIVGIGASAGRNPVLVEFCPS